MDIRDFVQAVVGALVLRPDEILMDGARQGSAILQSIGGSSPSYEALGGFSLLHTFALVVGLGLLIGTSVSTSVFIAAIVVLGVAGGLFAVNAVFEALGVNLNSLTAGVTGALSPAFSRPLVADAYVIFPFVVLALGAVRYRWGAGRRSKKEAEAAHVTLRRYCSYCGSVVRPGARKCGSCLRGAPKASERHCTSCGHFIPFDAKYCWFCGDEIKWIGPQRCPKCQGSMGVGATFCPACGTRQEAAEPAAAEG